MIDPVRTLTNAGLYLVYTRNLYSHLRVNEWARTPDYQACRILALALCEIHGASPIWLQKMKEEL